MENILETYGGKQEDFMEINWTPVTEKLPELTGVFYEEEFLVSVKIGDVRFREIARFDGEEWHNVLFDSEDVVAWAPLLPVYGD